MSTVSIYNTKRGRRLAKVTDLTGLVKLHHNFYSSRPQDGFAGTEPNPNFAGPDIPDINATVGTAITPIDCKALFSNDQGSAVWSKQGAWPAWLALSSVGVISGANPTLTAPTPCKVVCTQAPYGSGETNSFMVAAAPAPSPPPPVPQAAKESHKELTSHVEENHHGKSKSKKNT